MILDGCKSMPGGLLMIGLLLWVTSLIRISHLEVG